MEISISGVWCTLGTETPPRLWAKCPHAPLVCCYWGGARLIMCSLLQLRRKKGSGREAAGSLPRPAGSPGPQHCANESRGSGWAHTGGQGLLLRAKRSQEKRPRRRQQQGITRLNSSPAAERAFNLTLLHFFVKMDSQGAVETCRQALTCLTSYQLLMMAGHLWRIYCHSREVRSVKRERWIHFKTASHQPSIFWAEMNRYCWWADNYWDFSLL